MEVNMLITIREGSMFATSATVNFQQEIPDGGFSLFDLIFMARRLQVSSIWLAERLSQPQFEGAAGPHATELAILFGQNLDRIADVVIRNDRVNALAQNVRELAQQRGVVVNLDPAPTPVQAVRTQPRLNATTVSGDEICIICLHTAAETPGDEWVTAAGCTFHRFHRACMAPWRGAKCMVCARQLQAE
jgi:hypothetical protein